MNLKNKIFIIPIVFNLIVISVLYIDFLLPTNRIDKEIFSSFYNVVNNYPKFKSGGGQDVRCLLECKSGRIYHIPNFPNSFEELTSDQNIEIEKTFFLGKLKQVNFVEINQQFNLSILSENLILIVSIASILISLISLCIEFKYQEILLGGSFVYVLFTCALYFFYY